MAGGRSDDGADPREPAWHERTSTLLGASAGAVVVLGILYFLISSLLTGSDDPDPARQYFLEPSVTSGRFSTGTTTTTTEIVTSTSPPATTDINDPDAPVSTTSGTDTTSSDTSGATTTSRSPRSTDADDDGPTSRRPRFNETRTLYPRP